MRQLAAGKPRRSRGGTHPVAATIKVAALGVLGVAHLGQGLFPAMQPLLLKVVGGIIVLGVIALLARRAPTPTEVKLYFAFVGWAVMSAIAVAADLDLALRHGWTIFQMGLLFWGVALAHSVDPDLRITMWGLYGLGVLNLLLAYLNPEVMAMVQGEGEAYGRLSAMGENPNATAQVLVFALFSALYLGTCAKSFRAKALILSAPPAFMLFLLYTGSRKMLVASAVVLTVWLLTSKRVVSARGKTRGVYALLIVALATSLVLVSEHWEQTAMAKRWEREFAGYEGGSADRLELARQGLALFLAHPIAGVGLQNQVAIHGQVSHSEYVDVPASTGIVGAFLYFPIYLIAFRRARRVRRLGLSRVGADWHAFVTYLALLAWLMAGFTRFNDLLHLLAFGAFVGFFQAFTVRVRASYGWLPMHQLGSLRGYEVAGHQLRRPDLRPPRLERLAGRPRLGCARPAGCPNSKGLREVDSSLDVS